MAPLVAPAICRFAVNGTYDGRPVVNILDMYIDTTGSPTAREDACFAQCGIIINEWSDHILPLVSNNYTANDVSWIDLNSLTGSTGVRTSTDQETWPQTGEGASPPMSGAMAFRIDKNTVARRGQRQGRMYLVGAPEDATADGTPNELTPGIQTAINDELESFLGNINQGPGEFPDYESRLVVIHTVEDVFTSFSDVTALTVNERLGTQVRRLRG